MKRTESASRSPRICTLKAAEEAPRARPSRAVNRIPRPILCAAEDAGEIAWLRSAFKAAEIRNPVHFVGSGQQAIRYLAGASNSANGEAASFPCLVLLGLHLRGLSAFEVVERIRAQPALKTLVLVILSESQDPEGLAWASRLRANSFFLYPPDLAKYLKLARLLKALWLEEERSPGSGGPDPGAGGRGNISPFVRFSEARQNKIPRQRAAALDLRRRRGGLHYWREAFAKLPSPKPACEGLGGSHRPLEGSVREPRFGPGRLLQRERRAVKPPELERGESLLAR